MTRDQRQTRPGLVFEELEPRILLSAELSAAFVDIAPPADGALVQHVSASTQASQSATTLAAVTQRKELVVLDPRVNGYDKLVQDLLGQSGTGRNIEILLLDPNADGVAQLSELLAARSDISAVHLFSHGADGVIELGSTRLDFDSMRANAGAIQNWSDALTADADLLIYGCDVAGTEQGQAFVNALARLTGADVAASDDKTGAAELGGDWELEAQSGQIETAAAASAQFQQRWNGVLATYAVTNVNDSGAGSLRDSITQANASIGVVDTINFSIAGAGPHTIALASALPAIMDTVVLDATTQSGYAVGAPVIFLDGTSAGADANGFTLQASNSTIRGFGIQGFVNGTSATTGVGILIDGSAGGGDNNLITENYLTNNGDSVTGVVGAISIAGAADNNLVSTNSLVNNNADGIRFADASSTGNRFTGNVISGSGDDGVKLVGANITFTGNTVADSQRLTAGAAGIELDSVTGTSVISGNTVTNDGVRGTEGGLWIKNSSNVTVANNSITGQGGDGIAQDSLSVDNFFSQNSIFGNAGLGIDLNIDGVTANDAGDFDAGSNALQNFPVLTLAFSSGGNTTISGSLNSNFFTTFRIEFFSSPTADASNYGEGQMYLGFTTVSTFFFGTASFSVTLTGVSVPAGHVVSATASVDQGGGNYGSTSEFAQNIVATFVNQPPTITSDGGGSTASVTVAENTAAVTTVTASDADLPAQPLGYAIIGGADQTLLSINPTTGALSFNAAPNFELPADAGGDNVYDVIVEASDGNGGTDTQTINVTVTDVNDTPPLSPPPAPQPPTTQSPSTTPLPAPVTAQVAPPPAAPVDSGGGSTPVFASRPVSPPLPRPLAAGNHIALRPALTPNQDDNVTVARPAQPEAMPAPVRTVVEALRAAHRDVAQPDAAEHRAHIIASIATGTGFSLSAGFVAWLLRGGAMASSLLASAPLWRNCDPLPILANGRRGEPELVVSKTRRRTSTTSDREERAMRAMLRGDEPGPRA